MVLGVGYWFLARILVVVSIPSWTMACQATLVSAPRDTSTMLSRGEHMLISNVEIGGKSAGQFIIDTGSSNTVIRRLPADSPAIVKRSRVFNPAFLGGSREASVVTLLDVSVGTQHVPAIDALTLTDIEPTPKSWFDERGLLGTDFLARSLVTLDFRAGTVEFPDRNRFDPARSYVKYPLRVRNGNLQVEARIGGRPAWFILDTGMDDAIELYPGFANLNRDVLALDHIYWGVANGMGGQYGVMNCKLSNVVLFDRKLNALTASIDAEVAGSPPATSNYLVAGRIGAQALVDLILTLDIANQVVWVRWQGDESTNQLASRLRDQAVQFVNGETPLILAADMGRADVITALHAQGADPNAKSHDDETPLQRASWIADDEKAHAVVKALLRAGAKVNGVEPRIRGSALHSICCNGSLQAGKLIVAAGAEPNARDAYGQTPIFWAAYSDRVDLVELLLGAKADLTAVNNAGQTVLHAACWNGGLTAKSLLNAGADVRARDTNGSTPLHIAAAHAAIVAAGAIIASGGDVNAVNSAGATPLMLAASNYSGELVTLLLDQGADPELRDKEGKQAIDYAIRAEQNAPLRILLARENGHE